MKRSMKYREQYAAALAKQTAILDACEAANRDRTPEEETAWLAAKADMVKAKAKLDEALEHEAAEAVAPARSSTPAAGGTRIGVEDRAAQDPKKGFASHRDFLMAVIETGEVKSSDQVSDERLRPLAIEDDEKKSKGALSFALPTAFGPGPRAAVGSDEQGEYADTYGGYSLVHSRLAPRPLIGFEGDPTDGRCETIPMATPSVEMEAATDKNHTTSVAAGLIVTRRPEAGTMTGSRQAGEMITLKATSTYGLSFVTEELLADSPVSWIARLSNGFNSQFAAFKLNEKLRGVGGNERLGVLTALAASTLGPTISIAKESGQAAATIVSQNILKMRSRCWGYSQAIWIANHDTYPQLAVLSIAVGVAGGLVYQQSIVEDRPDMLLGRPIFYSEYASRLGQQGDLILGNWGQYMEGEYQPVTMAESIHVRFLNNERTLRFIKRDCGAPSWRVPLTPNQSTNTLSPFVVLDVR